MLCNGCEDDRILLGYSPLCEGVVGVNECLSIRSVVIAVVLNSVNEVTDDQKKPKRLLHIYGLALTKEHPFATSLLPAWPPSSFRIPKTCWWGFCCSQPAALQASPLAEPAFSAR